MINGDTIRWVLAAAISVLGGIAFYPGNERNSELVVISDRVNKAETKAWVVEYIGDHTISREEVDLKMESLSDKIDQCAASINDIKRSISDLREMK